MRGEENTGDNGPPLAPSIRRLLVLLGAQARLSNLKLAGTQPVENNPH